MGERNPQILTGRRQRIVLVIVPYRVIMKAPELKDTRRGRHTYCAW